MTSSNTHRYPAQNQDFTIYKVRSASVNGTYTYTWRYSAWLGSTFAHGGDIERYATKAEAMSAAYRAFYALVFAADVRDYDGPVDVSGVEAPCVDCGKSVQYATIDLLGRETCPESAKNGATPWGHRVNGSDYQDWQYLTKVAQAKAVLVEQA